VERASTSRTGSESGTLFLLRIGKGWSIAFMISISLHSAKGSERVTAA